MAWRPDRDDGPAPDLENLRTVALASAGVVGTLQAGTAIAALRARRRDYADVVWGPGLAAVAVTSAVLGRGHPGRRWGTAVIAGAWALRLGSEIAGRIRRSDDEDPRYSEWLEGDGTAAVVAKVFGTQAVSQLFVAAPIQVAAASRLPRGPRRWLAPAGLAVMATGVVVEALADRQKATYSERPKDDRPEVLDTGLWGWSRHPNYFGDSLIWDGAWLAGATSTAGALTFPAPVAMSYLLIVATGAKRTERRMQERPGYRDYQRRVAFFFPRPPRD